MQGYGAICLLVLLAGCAQQALKPQPPEPSPSIEAPILAAPIEFAVQPTLVAPYRPPNQALVTDPWERIRARRALPECEPGTRTERYAQTYARSRGFRSDALGRATRYMPMVLDQMEGSDLPLELALLPLVESHYEANQRSSQGAAGAWQFMPATARSMGLVEDFWYDGRMDLHASTHAALSYFQRLYDEFDQDPLIAMAAYNAGEGRIRRVLRGMEDSPPSARWAAIPRHIQDHVKRWIAVACLAHEPERYALVEALTATNSPRLVPTPIDSAVALPDLARALNLDPLQLAQDNPGFRRGLTPPNRSVSVLIPQDSAQSMRGLGFLGKPDPGKLWRTDAAGVWLQTMLLQRGEPVHEVLPHDSWDSIAQYWKLSPEALAAANRTSTAITPPASGLLIIPQAAALPGQRSGDRYVVRSGDNLWTIARRLRVKLDRLMQHNRLNRRSVLRPGQVLRVP